MRSRDAGMAAVLGASRPLITLRGGGADAGREFTPCNEATVHRPSRENAAQLALAVVSVPSVDVREVLHLLHALQARGSLTILAE
jgi:hypothetical protein